MIYFLLCFLSTSLAHDFHLSRCEMSIKEDGIEASLHIFIDDLELALQRMGSDGLYLGQAQEVAYANERIEDYINEKIRINTVEESIKWELLGKEMSNDLQAFWVHFYWKQENLKVEEILFDLLMECYDDQKNILVVEKMGDKAHFLLTKNEYIAELN